MIRFHHLRTVLAVAVLLASVASAWGQRRRSSEPYERFQNEYTALFADGSFVRGKSLTGWERDNDQARLDGKRLFDEENPVRWVRHDHAEYLAPPRAFVELGGGDLLPGRVVEFVEAGSDGVRSRRAHVLVAPDVSLRRSDGEEIAQLPVSASWIARIVWDGRFDSPAQPGTLRYSDGTRLSFRTARLRSQGLEFLTDEGRREVPFSQLAEVCFPRRDPWEVYLETLAVLSPGASTLLVRMETVDHLRATTSLARLRPLDGPRRYGRQQIHPAWSLTAFSVDHPRIARRLVYRPHEVPLSLVAPERIETRAGLMGAGRVRVDANVDGGPLASGQRDYGWGWGTKAESMMYIPLPELARALRGTVALDRLAGDGGCARALVYLNTATGKPLVRSELLRGCSETFDLGQVWLKESNEQPRRLVLVTDMAHDDRPEGADPLDVRDLVDWLEPVLELDFEQLRDAVRRRSTAAVAAWDGWEVRTESGEPVLLTSDWGNDDKDNLSDVCRLLAQTRGRKLTLRRKLTVGPQDRYFVLVATRAGDQAGRLVVRANGRLLGEFPLEEAEESDDASPVLVDVADLAGRSVDFEIEQTSDDSAARVAWDTIALAEHSPEVLPIFDEQSDVLDLLAMEQGQARWTTDEAFSGRGCLRIESGSCSNARWPGLWAEIRRSPRLGQYRYLALAWKQVGGGQLAVQLADNESFEVLGRIGRDERAGGRFGRFFGGRDRDWRRRGPAEISQRLLFYTGDEPPGSPDGADVSLASDRLAEQLDWPPDGQWTPVVIDLARFESLQLNLSGLRLICQGGQYGLFDQIVLARDRKSLEQYREQHSRAEDKKRTIGERNQSIKP